MLYLHHFRDVQVSWNDGSSRTKKEKMSISTINKAARRVSVESTKLQ